MLFKTRAVVYGSPWAGWRIAVRTGALALAVMGAGAARGQRALGPVIVLPQVKPDAGQSAPVLSAARKLVNTGATAPRKDMWNTATRSY
jgi:hypothetical protein